jgi:hypothetical protein
VIGGTLVWLRHRQPKSVDANVASFNRGLRALAPDGDPIPPVGESDTGRARTSPPRPSGLRVIRTDEDIDLSEGLDATQDEPGAAETAGKRAGAESG